MSTKNASNIRPKFDLPEIQGEQIQPDPAGTASAFSRIGYEFEEAIADLVDNSIDANAKTVLIRFFYTNDALERIAIVDNGRGLTTERLNVAMQFGGQAERKPTDLGKFGIGLKAASFSQCTSLSLLTRVDRAFNGRRWTMESIKDNWTCLHLNKVEVKTFLTGDWGGVELSKSGTVILWDGLDISNKSEKVNKLIRDLSKSLQGHLGLIFHRFISNEKVKIIIDSVNLDNGNVGTELPVSSLDPFDYNRSGKRGYPRTFHIAIPGQAKLAAEAHIWPAKSTSEGYKLGTRNTAFRQGIYFYRNDRLIQGGGWSGIRDNNSEPHLSLARVKINLLPDSEQYLILNVQKSHIDARPVVRDAFESARDRSKTFHQYIQDAEGVYRGQDKPSSPIIVAGSGFPEGVRRESRRIFGSAGNPRSSIEIKWFKRMNTDTIFSIDRENKILRLNEKYRTQLETVDGSDSVFKSLIFMLVREEFGRTRASKSHGDAINRLNSLLLASLED